MFLNDFVKAYRCVVVGINAYVIAADMVLDVFFVVVCIVVLMTVKHKAVLIVFHVPVKDRIMHHYKDFAFVSKFFVWPDEAEDVRLEVDAVDELVMVADDEMFFAAKLQKVFLNFVCVATERDVAQNVDFIVILDGFVPVFNEFFVHFFDSFEWTVAELDDVLVSEMQVAGYVYHLDFPFCITYCITLRITYRINSSGCSVAGQPFSFLIGANCRMLLLCVMF